MFRTKKAEILSVPAEEVLEATVRAPQPEEQVSIHFARVEGSLSFITYGTLVDYNGHEYQFEWDTTRNKVARLTGSRVTPFLWSSAQDALEEILVSPVESPDVVGLLTREIQSVKSSVETGLRAVDQHIEVLNRPVPAPVVQPERPKAVSKPTPVEETAMADPDENLIMANALKFLQESQDEDLGIDYLGL